MKRNQVYKSVDFDRNCVQLITSCEPAFKSHPICTKLSAKAVNNGFSVLVLFFSMTGIFPACNVPEQGGTVECSNVFLWPRLHTMDLGYCVLVISKSSTFITNNGVR